MSTLNIGMKSLVISVVRSSKFLTEITAARQTGATEDIGQAVQ
jgi:hypothetical protein